MAATEPATSLPLSLPPIPSLPSLPPESRAEILDLLFEPSLQLHTLSLPLLHDTTFESYTEMIGGVGKQLEDLRESRLQSDQKWLNDILGSHPRLGEKKVEGLSEASRSEQAQLQAKTGGDGGEEVEKLRALNKRFEERFGGMKYVVFVNGRPRPVIMQDMERRIDRGDLEQEKEDAIQAMCDIAVDRARKMGGS